MDDDAFSKASRARGGTVLSRWNPHAPLNGQEAAEDDTTTNNGKKNVKKVATKTPASGKTPATKSTPKLNPDNVELFKMREQVVKKTATNNDRKSPGERVVNTKQYPPPSYRNPNRHPISSRASSAANIYTDNKSKTTDSTSTKGEVKKTTTTGGGVVSRRSTPTPRATRPSSAIYNRPGRQSSVTGAAGVQQRPISAAIKKSPVTTAGKPPVSRGGVRTSSTKTSSITVNSSPQHQNPSSAAGKPPPVTVPNKKVPPPTAVVSPIISSQQQTPPSPVTRKNSVDIVLRKKSTSSSSPVTKTPPSPLPSPLSNKDEGFQDGTPEKKNISAALQDDKARKRSSSSVAAANKNKKPTTTVTKLGHNFVTEQLKEWINWCDACGGVIMAVFGGTAQVCTKCRMMCHPKCVASVSLTCEADQVSGGNEDDNDSAFHDDGNFMTAKSKTIVQETKLASTLKEYNTINKKLTTAELHQRIAEFNLHVKASQQMTLQEDGTTFKGFIRVTMNLTRPVSINNSNSKNPQEKASFYIDKGALKALYLTSNTTAEEVVQALLDKYKIIDNPHKFSLFEKQPREEGHVILRKLLPRERPLLLRLLWGNGKDKVRNFILQENESRDIQWESFSMGELQMFIKILEKEENDYIQEIKKKYRHKEEDIKKAIQEKGGKT